MGRTSLMLVIAFNVIFMAMGFRLSNASSSAYLKYSGYAALEQASLAVESGANIAISDAFFGAPTAIPTTTAFDFPSAGQGTIQITKTPLFDAVGVLIGDSLTISGSRNIPNGTLTDDQVKSQTSIRVQGNSFSQYVMYSVTENIGPNPIYWMTGEVCRGPLHTQDNLYVNGNPTFADKVTIYKKLTKEPGSVPNFMLGYTEGVNITLPSDLTDLKNLGAAGVSNQYVNVKVFVQFNSNGSVTVRTATGTQDGWAKTPASPAVVVGSRTYPACATYSSVSALTSTGVLVVNNSELHVKGRLDGRITLGAVGSGSIVMLDSSVVYKDRPPTSLYPTNVSNDLLGIICENDIRVTDTYHPSTSSGPSSPPNYTPANNNNNNSALGVNIDASMFSLTGGFGSERYDTRGDCGYVRISGGIQQQGRDPVGQISSHLDGFRKDYAFDTRLYTDRPIGYPTTPFLVQSWRDSTKIPDSFWQ